MGRGTADGEAEASTRGLLVVLFGCVRQQVLQLLRKRSYIGPRGPVGRLGPTVPLPFGAETPLPLPLPALGAGGWWPRRAVGWVDKGMVPGSPRCVCKTKLSTRTRSQQSGVGGL